MQDKREKVVQALHRCMREKGFARTSLTDIAVKAEMSPSHVRYYFENKDAILEHYLDRLCRQIIADVRQIPTDDPHLWLERFGDFFIANPKISRDAIAVLVEAFGVSVHDPALREIKIRYDNEIRTILEEFFEAAGCADGTTPKAAAEIAQAVEAGLKYNSVFQDSYSAGRAQNIFRAVMTRLMAAPAPVRAPARTRRRKTAG